MKKYWREILILSACISPLGLIVGVVLAVKYSITSKSDKIEWVENLLSKVAYDGKEPNMVSVSYNGKLLYDENGNQVTVTAKGKYETRLAFLLLFSFFAQVFLFAYLYTIL